MDDEKELGPMYQYLKYNQVSTMTLIGKLF